MVVNPKPTLTVGIIPAICVGAMSFTIPYSGSTGTPTTYSISGTGITPVTDAALPNSPITVNLSAAASGSSVGFTLTVKNGDGCTSADITGSVTVNDLPTVSSTASLFDNNTIGQCGKIITYNSSSTGVPAPIITYALTGVTTASGSGNGSGLFFNVGKTTVTLTATNSCGTGTYSFNVTITDVEKPVVTCKNLSLDFTFGGSITLTPQDVLQSVSDNCSTIKSLSIDRTLPFNGGNVGTNFVILTATDNANNQSTCTATISVTRNELPQVICPSSQIINIENLGTDGTIPPTTATTNMPSTSLNSTDKLMDMPCGTTTPPSGFPFNAPFNATMATGADRIVVRAFSATFIGFSSTCSQVFYIQSPHINTAQAPAATAAATCQSRSPEVTGYPKFSNGNPITDNTAGLTSSYTDGETANGVFQRTWTVKSKCGTTQFTQIITLPICITPQIAISGAIKRETSENVVATVKIYNTRDSINKAEGSFYSFPSVPVGESYRVKPERNTDVLNGVTTYDINVIAKYLLGIETAKSPYQLIAMDVNRNGEIESGDMLLIRNLILRKTDNFPNNTAWRFIPKSYIFKNPTNPFAEDFPEILSVNNPTENINNADFVAVKIGDGNLSARADNFTAIQVRNTPEIAFLELEDRILEAGKEYRIPVKTGINSLNALQFALNIDKNAVEMFRIENGDLAQFSEGNYEKGVVTTAWASTKYTSENTVLLVSGYTIFTLIVKAKKQISIRDLISLNTGFTSNLAYNTVTPERDDDGSVKGGEKQLQLQFSSGKQDKPLFELHQNRPNPFSHETTISFILSETNTAELSIFDITGRKVYTLNRSFSKGYNEVILNKSVLQNTGVYFYRLQADKFMAVKRLFYLN